MTNTREERPATGTVPTTEGIELAYERHGSGPSALVVPSMSWLARDLERLAAGRSVVFYDIRGRGRSTAIFDEGRLGLEKDVDDLERLRTALGLERISLLGWSYHGALAARYALAHSDRVERLILVGPSAPAALPYFHDFLEDFSRRVDLPGLQRLGELRQKGMKTADPRGWCREVHTLFFRAYVADPASLSRMRSSPCVEPNLDADRVNDQGRRVIEKLGDYDWRGDYADFAIPTLILHGAEDPVVLSGTLEWERILPEVRLVVFDDVGHMPWLEVPERFFDTVERFLGGEWPE